jgi:hypothetical protein
VISDDQAAVLRAALQGDTSTFDRLESKPHLDDSVEVPALVAHAFVTATRRRFSGRWTDSDVIRLVGQLRARKEGEHADVSAQVAEQMLLSVLHGQPMPCEDDKIAMGYAQFALLAELVTDLDGVELDALLGEARRQADLWLAEIARHSEVRHGLATQPSVSPIQPVGIA